VVWGLSSTQTWEKMKVDNTAPCDSRLISKQDVGYKPWVYNAFCEKPVAIHRPCTMVRRSEGLHSLDVVWVKWLSMENSPDKGNNDTFNSCSSSHSGSGIFFHSSQYRTNISGVRTDQSLPRSDARGAKDLDSLSRWWSLVNNVWDGILRCGYSA
jgi:hypothetical protein